MAAHSSFLFRLLAPMFLGLVPDAGAEDTKQKLTTFTHTLAVAG